jgi:hypothetical protein
MPNRRSVLIGLSGVVAGGGALFGTGAFTTVTAERAVSVETAGDASALLQLTGNEDYGDDDTDVAEHVSTTDTGTLQLTFDSINRNAVTRFDDLLSVANQGTQEIKLYVNVDAGEEGVDPIYGQGYTNDGPLDVLYGGTYTADADGQGDSDSIVGGNVNQTPRANPLTLDSGDSATLTVVIDTRGTGSQSWDDGEIQFVAES